MRERQTSVSRHQTESPSPGETGLEGAALGVSFGVTSFSLCSIPVGEARPASLPAGKTEPWLF